MSLLLAKWMENPSAYLTRVPQQLRHVRHTFRGFALIDDDIFSKKHHEKSINFLVLTVYILKYIRNSRRSVRRQMARLRGSSLEK